MLSLNKSLYTIKILTDWIFNRQFIPLQNSISKSMEKWDFFWVNLSTLIYITNSASSLWPMPLAMCESFTSHPLLEWHPVSNRRNENVVIFLKRLVHNLQSFAWILEILKFWDIFHSSKAKQNLISSIWNLINEFPN